MMTPRLRAIPSLLEDWVSMLTSAPEGIWESLPMQFVDRRTLSDTMGFKRLQE